MLVGGDFPLYPPLDPLLLPRMTLPFPSFHPRPPSRPSPTPPSTSPQRLSWCFTPLQWLLLPVNWGCFKPPLWLPPLPTLPTAPSFTFSLPLQSGISPPPHLPPPSLPAAPLWTSFNSQRRSQNPLQHRPSSPSVTLWGSCVQPHPLPPPPALSTSFSPCEPSSPGKSPPSPSA